MNWLKSLWAHVGFWVKLLGLALLGAFGFLTYLRLKANGLEAEAADLQRRLVASKAEAKVAFLEGQKAKNQERLDVLPHEEERLDSQLEEARAKLEELQRKTLSASDEEILRKFKELGY